MQKNIHPDWHHDAIVTCSCGNTFTTGLTQKTLQVDICSACHPFFTGEMRFVDRQGRVDKFLAKQKKAQATQAKTQKPKKQIVQDDPKSYRDLLRQQQRALGQKAQKQAADSKDKEEK